MSDQATEHAELMKIGESAYSALVEMVEALDTEDEAERERAEQAIHEDPLSIEFTGKWSIGEAPRATGFEILLATGGPAVRIVGELDDHGEPDAATLEVQDWFKPWTAYPQAGSQNDDADVLLTYCRQFYFGE
jgi:hypothetical protein